MMNSISIDFQLIFHSRIKKLGFMRGLGPKGPLSGVPHPTKIESGYGPG